MNTLIGYLSFLLMGLILGLMGAGGSILTIPILIYLFKFPVLLSTTYSFAIVGTISLITSIRCWKNISFKEAYYFLLSSVLGVLCSRSYVLPHLPESIGPFKRDNILLFILIIFMLTAGFLMIIDFHLPKTQNTNHPRSVFYQKRVMALGFFLGIFMGLLGTGGGFLIVPTLVLLVGLPMKKAIPTSLLIVASNSLVGFFSDKAPFYGKDWKNIAVFSAIALVGMLAGNTLHDFFPPQNLKKGFGLLVLAVASFMIFRQITA